MYDVKLMSYQTKETHVYKSFGVTVGKVTRAYSIQTEITVEGYGSCCLVMTVVAVMVVLLVVMMVGRLIVRDVAVSSSADMDHRLGMMVVSGSSSASDVYGRSVMSDLDVHVGSSMSSVMMVDEGRRTVMVVVVMVGVVVMRHID